MKCLRCNEILNEGTTSCSKCGFIFDNNRVGNELTKNEYQQLGVIDNINILIQSNTVLLRGTQEEILNARNLYNQIISNCNQTVIATFVGIRKIPEKNKFINHRKEQETINLDLKDKIKKEQSIESIYPIFRYEYNGVIYVSEGFYPIQGECPYVIGNDYQINIHPATPNMIIYSNNIPKVEELEEKIITDKFIKSILIKIIAISLIILLFLGSFFTGIGKFLSTNLGKGNYIETTANLIDKRCEKECIGIYEFYSKGIQFTIETEEPQKKLPNKINIKYAPNNPDSYVILDSKNSGTIIGVIIPLIFIILFSIVDLFYIKLFKRCITV